MAYTLDTKLKVLLKDPRACEVLEKNLPGMGDDPSIKMAGAFSLKQITKMPQAKEIMTPEVLSAIEADLAALE